METKKKELTKTLKFIFDSYGIDLLGDYIRVNALLMDLAPNNNKERKLICSVLREGIGVEIAKVVGRNQTDQQHALKKCIIQIKSDTWIAEEAAEFAVAVIANSLGIEFETISPARNHTDNSDCSDRVNQLIKGQFSGDVNNLNSFLAAYTEIGYKAFAADTRIKELIIPESVTCIKAKAFLNCINLIKISLPSNIECIGWGAFQGCTALESISITQGKKYTVINGMLLDRKEKTLIRMQNQKTMNDCQIPDAIVTIAPFAFDRCPIKSVRIPRTVTNIHENTFSYCYQLEQYKVDPHNSQYASPDGVLYNRTKTVLLRYPSGRTNSGYMVEEDAEEIADSAFSGSLNLETITFSNTVKKIGCKAFEYCKKLSSLVIPASVEVIGERAFQNCDSLESVMLPRSINEIGDFAFSECISIKTISIPKGVQKIGHAAFSNCKALRRIVFQENVSSLGDGVFDGCDTNLEIIIRSNSFVEAYCRAHNLHYTKM